LEITSPEYISLDHPLQKRIITSLAEMAELRVDQINLGIDGCSAPNFAIPLRCAAQAFARLCDPAELSSSRAQACRKITSAMMAYPTMVAGRERFDTRLMDTFPGRIVSKGGAEGYQGIGIMRDMLFPGSPALGIAIKIADGDLNGRARPAVTLEVLNQLGAISEGELEKLVEFGPVKTLKNWRQKEVGTSQPSFNLHIHTEFLPRE
jgi:L-asparaginase II